MRQPMLIVLLLAPVTVAAQDVSVIEVNYQATVTDWHGDVRLAETGTHTFARDGRHRLDREVNGERTTRLSLPDRGVGGGERIEINHTARVARRGPLNMRTGPFLALERPFSEPGDREILPDSLEHREAMDFFSRGGGQPAESLGVKAVGPMLLHGQRVSFPAQNGFPAAYLETWSYQLPDGEMIDLEIVDISTLDDGRTAQSSMTIQRAVRTTVPASYFTMPTGFRVQDLWERAGIER